MNLTGKYKSKSPFDKNYEMIPRSVRSFCLEHFGLDIEEDADSKNMSTKVCQQAESAVVSPIFDTFIRPVGLEPLTENDPTGGLNLSRPIPDFSYGVKRRFRRKSRKYFFGGRISYAFLMIFL